MTEYIGYNGYDAPKPKPAAGGDVILQVGKGANGGANGSFLFKDADENEVLRIDPVGRFWVNGKVAANDLLVYEAFRLWLSQATATLEGNAQFNVRKERGPE
jgi:hypothetical protein